MNINDIVGSCPLHATSDRQIDLHDYRRQWVVWRKVKVSGHVNAVYEMLKSIQ